MVNHQKTSSQSGRNEREKLRLLLTKLRLLLTKVPGRTNSATLKDPQPWQEIQGKRFAEKIIS